MHFVQILVSILLVLVILIQVRGQGTGLFGSTEGGYRTRRGVERVLFQTTIGLAAVFILVSIISAYIG